MAISTDIERLNYYEGEYLGAVDFAAEQDYQRDMRRRHNVGQHTWGIVAGLELALIPNGQTSGAVAQVDAYVQPGMATDGFGREVVVLNQTPLTQDLFAAYYNPNPSANAQYMAVWITYAQQLVQPSQDACTSQNTNDPFGRIQETFQLVVTQAGTTPTDDSLIIDGSTVNPATVTASVPPPTAPDGSVLPPDLSIPYQQFPTDETNLFWYIPLGQVLWNPNSGVLLSTTSADTGRAYAGMVSAEIYAPVGQLTIADRNSPNPPPASPKDPNLGGVSVTIAGSLNLDYLLNPSLALYVGAAYPPGNNPAISPLTIVGADTNQDLIQFRDPTGNPLWQISDNLNGDPGISVYEVASKADRLFIQAQLTGSVPSPLNIGVGSTTPRNPLAIRAQGSWDELLSFEDSNGTTKWHLNRNPQGKTPQGAAYQPGLNFVETQAGANFRLFLEEGGNVGVGTPLPEQNLSVNAGLNIDQAGANSGTISPGPGLTFGSASGEGIASNRTGGANKDGLDFYTSFAARMSITQQGLVGIGLRNPQSSLHLAGGEWDLTNTEGDLKIGNPAMRMKFGVALGGAGAGDGRIRVQGGTNRLMLGSNTDDILTIVNGMVGVENSSPAYTLDVNGTGHVNGDLTISGNRTYLAGLDGAGDHWLMGGGVTETVYNALGFNPGNPLNLFNLKQILIGPNWSLTPSPEKPCMSMAPSKQVGERAGMLRTGSSIRMASPLSAVMSSSCIRTPLDGSAVWTIGSLS